ncbi:MAG: hypothetical protein ACLPLZ_11600 [Terracidiphilus sp.]
MFIVAILAGTTAAKDAAAQDVPLISGGVGFFTNTTNSTGGSSTSYQPHIEPLIAAPLGKSLLVESRAILLEEFSPNGNGQPGYTHSHFADLIYLQGDYVASAHLTVVAGSFLLPFNTYNDRLSPIWIGDLQDGPLIAGVGTMASGTGVGGMLSGSAFSSNKASISYNAWFSARSGNFYFNSERSSGGRASLFLPEDGLEIGASYDRLLQGTQENFVGAHVWWRPKDTGFRLRSEYARDLHEQGYWIEADYRAKAFGGFDSWVGRLEPVFRMQQFERNNIRANNGTLGVDTVRPDIGLDYNLPHETRILFSYSHQASNSSAGNDNIWETGIVYRFLFPTWKGKDD